VGDVEVDGLPGVFELFGAMPPVPVPVWLTPSGVGCEGDVVGEVFGDVVGDVGDVVGDVVCAEAAAAPNVSARAAPRVRERLRMVELSCGGGSLVLAARSTGVTMRAEGKVFTRTACAGKRGNSRYEGRRSAWNVRQVTLSTRFYLRRPPQSARGPSGGPRSPRRPRALAGTGGHWRARL
jgi:hypothetical protein